MNKNKNLLEDFELYKSQLRSLNEIFQNSKQKIEKQLDFFMINLNFKYLKSWLKSLDNEKTFLDLKISHLQTT